MVLPVSCCPLAVTVTFVFSPNGASYETLGHRPRYTHATTQALTGRDNRRIIEKDRLVPMNESVGFLIIYYKIRLKFYEKIWF